MRILFWVPYPSEGASNRYRVEQYLGYLEKEGIEFSVHSFWGRRAFRVLYTEGNYLKKISFFILSSIRRFLDLLKMRRYDIVFIHREAYPIGGGFLERILRMIRKPYIFDFDDAIFLPVSSNSSSFIEKIKNCKKAAAIIKGGSNVIAGNSYLADYALRYNDQVSVIPTPIDTKKYSPYESKASNQVIIGWIGSVTTSGFLSLLNDVFVELSKKYQNIKFKILGGVFSAPGLTNIISNKWNFEREIEELRTFDIGIMPMPDNAWTRGKCGFKAILYMSMGIPCICSPVGFNKEIITDGVNGFLASGNEEWFRKLSLLIEDNQLRRDIGLRGRATVEQRYSVEVNAPNFLDVINKVYKKEKKKEDDGAEKS